ncbi:MAG TPA: ATP-binding protein [Chloroflexota bacterium]
MNTQTRLYVAGVVVAGALLAPATVLLAWPRLTVELLAATLILLALALATELISVTLPRGGDLVASTIVHVAAIFILPLPLAVLVASGSVLVGQVLARRRWSRVLFNVGQTVLSVGVPAMLAHLLAEDNPLLAPGSGWEDLPDVLLVLVVYYVLNSLFVNLAVALSEGLSLIAVWRENNAMVILPDFGMGVVGVLVAYVWRTDPVWSVLTLLPAVITIVSFRQIRRIEEESERNARLLEETRRLNVRLGVLAEAGQRFNAVLDAERVLERVAETCAEALGDVCAVSTVDAAGRAGARLIRARPGVAPLTLVPPDWGGGRDPPDGPATCRSLAGPSGASVAVLDVPLRVGTRHLGALSLARPDGRGYDEQEIRFARALADRAAVALENAFLLAESEAAVRARDEFLSVAAHELKTPLTSLLGFSELLLRQLERTGGVDPALAGRALRPFREQTSQMARLVEQLLWFSRLQAGHQSITRQPVDLVLLVQGAVAAARASAGDRTLLVSAPPALPARVDPPRIEQVLANLLDNALKYSPQSTAVEVVVGAAGPAEASVAVRDRGRGVAPEHRPHLFDRSYGAPTVRHVSGLGLGLHISRQIVELHGGRLWAEFPEDGGTRFVMLLPTAGER